MNLAAPGQDHVFAVGRESVVGEKVAGVEGLLVVALNRVLQPALVTGGEVADAESGFGFITRAIDQLGAVGRNFRTEGTFGSVGDGVVFTGDAVVADDLRKRKLCVVGQAIFAGGIVQVAAIP